MDAREAKFTDVDLSATAQCKHQGCLTGSASERTYRVPFNSVTRRGRKVLVVAGAMFMTGCATADAAHVQLFEADRAAEDRIQ